MDTAELAELLVKAGYKVRGRLPASGWVLIAPDGRFVLEGDFLQEVDRITRPIVLELKKERESNVKSP